MRHPQETESRRRTFLSRVPLLGLLFAGAASPPLASGEERGGILARLEAVEKAVKQTDLPIGTVISMGAGRPHPEALWLACDGQSHFRAEFEELATLLGVPNTEIEFIVPNLGGRVLRGAVMQELSLALGGTDRTPRANTDDAGHHSHGLPDYTGLVSDKLPPGVPNAKPPHETLIWNETAWTVSDFWNEPDNGKAEGQHYHILGGNTKEDGKHAHSLPDLPCVPSYAAVRFFIKAKRL